MRPELKPMDVPPELRCKTLGMDCDGTITKRPSSGLDPSVHDFIYLALRTF